MASEEPKANWLRVGRLNASWWATISGFQTSTKPATTMMLWAKIAIVPMISLKLVETLIPRTLSQTSKTIPATDSTSHSQARWIGPSVMVKSIA